MRQNPQESGTSGGSVTGLLLHLFWSAFGNLPLVFIPMMIIKEKNPAFGKKDIIFVVCALALLVARLIDAKVFNPAPAAEVRKYVLIMPVVSAALLAAGHVIAGLLA